MKAPTVLRTQSGSIFLSFTVDKARYRFAPVKDGQYDNALHYNQALRIASQIAVDVGSGKFDSTLENYRPLSVRQILDLRNKAEITLLSVWEDYINIRKRGVSQTTYDITYKSWSRLIAKCPYKKVIESKEILDWIIETQTPNQSARVLLQINAACNWAVDREILTGNPFKNYKKSLNSKPRKQREEIDPFTVEERDRIIEAFYAHKRYSFHAPLVEFLFFTGCRPSEALALEWIDYENGRIYFEKAWVNSTLKRGLKSEENRVIIANEKVKEILVKQRKVLNEKGFHDSKLIFPSNTGKSHVSWSIFGERKWKPLLKRLEGIRYKTPYQMRHTFITLSIQKASMQDVARHVGNTTTMIARHYAGHTRDFVSPEI